MNHIEYMNKKADHSIKEWNQLMHVTGMFKDLEKLRAFKNNLDEDGD